jgi:hypothetical protein
LLDVLYVYLLLDMRTEEESLLEVDLCYLDVLLDVSILIQLLAHQSICESHNDFIDVRTTKWTLSHRNCLPYLLSDRLWLN